VAPEVGLLGSQNWLLPMNITIRELKSDDYLDLLEIRNHPGNYQWFFSQRPVGFQEHVDWVESRIKTHAKFTLVALLNEKVIGTCYLRDPNDTVPEVSINVSPDFKGVGVGSSLLNEIIDRAKEANINALAARIMSNNLDSIGFFRSNGFVELKKQSPGTIELTLIH